MGVQDQAQDFRRLAEALGVASSVRWAAVLTSVSSVGHQQTWSECHAGLPPGGYLALVNQAGQEWDCVALELRLAGFRLRDCLRVTDGRLVLLTQKPPQEDNLTNLLLHGVGGLNIDGCRTPGLARTPASIRAYRRFDLKGDKPALVEPPEPNPLGRWPANLLLMHDHQQAIPCGSSCPSTVLNSQAARYGEVSSFLPQFWDDQALLAWLVRLITPPGGVCWDPYDRKRSRLG